MLHFAKPLGFFVVGMAVMGLIVLGASSVGSFWPSSRERLQMQPGKCVLRFEHYVPSEMEERWARNIDAWKDDALCSHLDKDKNLFAEMYAYTTATTRAALAGSRKRIPSPTHADAIFSKFYRRYDCDDPTNPLHGKEHVDVIEPLVGGLRDMRVFPECAKQMEVPVGELCSRDFTITMDHWEGTGKRVEIYDFGASTYRGGACGASQSWLVDTYRGKGFTLANIQMWELGANEATARFAEVPDDVLPFYQYFRIGVSGDPTSKFSPWKIIKSRREMADWAVVKLDIDGGPEEVLVSQLLADKELDGIVIEMFFEHHTTLREMLGAWWPTNPPKGTKSIADSYRMFLELRNKGVRMHAWP